MTDPRSLTLPAGITLTYDDVGDPDAPPVLLVHGLSGSRETYERVVAHLCRADAPTVRVVTIDLRGHGDSGHATADGYTADDYVADLEGFITAIGAGPALVVGHSLGGVVAAHLAVQRPDLVASLLLEDPPLFEGDDARRAASPVASFFPLLVSAVRALQADGAPSAAYDELVRTHTDPDEVHERCRSLARWDPATMDAAITGSLWGGFDPLAPIRHPLTVLRADPAVGAVFAEADVDPLLAANPHASVHLVPGASHSIHATATLPQYLTHLDRVVEAFVGA